MEKKLSCVLGKHEWEKKGRYFVCKICGDKHNLRIVPTRWDKFKEGFDGMDGV